MNAPDNIYIHDSEFIPCPFCGCTDIHFDGIYAGEEVPGKDWVVCEGCGSSAPSAEAWNTRHDLHAAVEAERDELRNMLILCGEPECVDVQGYPEKLRALIDGVIGLRSEVEKTAADCNALREKYDGLVADMNTAAQKIAAAHVVEMAKEGAK